MAFWWKLISLFLLPLQNGFKHLFMEQEIQVYWKLLTVSRTFWVTKMREFTTILLRCFCHSCPCMTARLELEKLDVRGRWQSAWLLKHRGMSSGLCNGEHEIQSGLDIVWSMSGFVDRNSTKRYDLSNMDRQKKLFFLKTNQLQSAYFNHGPAVTRHRKGSRRFQPLLVLYSGWNWKLFFSLCCEREENRGPRSQARQWSCYTLASVEGNLCGSTLTKRALSEWHAYNPIVRWKGKREEWRGEMRPKYGLRREGRWR